MTRSADDDALHEVQRMLGQCLLRLQAYEHLMKSIVAAHRVSASSAAFEKAFADRVSETSRKTLGTLVGELMGSLLVPDGQQGMKQSQDEVSSVAFQMQIVLSAEDFARTEADLRDLVALRNRLVHHFVEEHELGTREGCLGAQEALAQALDRISAASANLRSWAEDMMRVRVRTAEYLSSADFQALIVAEHIP